MANLTNCSLNGALLQFQEWAMFTDSFIVMPFYLTVGFSSNIILLIAFYKQSKHDNAYSYQVTLTLSKSCEIFSFSMFIMSYKWCAAVETPTGCPFFMKNYSLMFYAAHIACPVFNGFIIISLLMSVAMSADRVFALSKPFIYKNINHKKHHAISTTVCVLIGVWTSAFEVQRWTVVWPNENGTLTGDETWKVKYDEIYLATDVAIALGHLRTVIRILAVFTLISLNIALAVVFRQRNRKVGQMAANDTKEKERRAAEKTLLILTVYQSVLNAIAQAPHSGYSIMAAAFPEFNSCYGIVVAPFVDMAIELADSADFFVIMAINKRMRRVVLNVFPCKCEKSEVVGRASSTAGGPTGNATV
jgi:hypothetical protein